jgi:hypothetical protein
MRLRRIASHDEGQVLPALVVLLTALLAAGILLYQAGQGAVLASQGQTAADAAALAAAKEAQRQRQEQGPDADAMQLDFGRIEAVAREYAEKNRGELKDFQVKDANSFDSDFQVTVLTHDRLGPDAKPVDAEGKGALEKAQARLDATYSVGGLGLPGGPGGPGGPNGGGLPKDELQDLADKAGFPIRPDSALRVYGTNPICHTVDVEDLIEPMKIAIIKAEHYLGKGLKINSAYRTPACQAVTQPCGTCPIAAPGRSLHNVGQAIDVDPPLVAEVNAIRDKVGMGHCINDKVHLSWLKSVECAGGANTGGAGGGLASFVKYEIRLVHYDGA